MALNAEGTIVRRRPRSSRGTGPARRAATAERFGRIHTNEVSPDP
jgi:hypothetical protein